MTAEVKEHIKAFWNSSNRKYDEVKAHGIHSASEKELWRKAFVQLVNGNQSQQVLDMGTGTGFIALLIAEMGHDVTGADWSENMMTKAKEKLVNTDLNIKFLKEDAENLSFADNTFDVVVSRHLLWTLVNPSKAIREWVRVTKNRGKIMVDIPHEHVGSHHFGEEIGKKLPFYNGATPEMIAGMFKKLGLAEVQIQHFDVKDKELYVVVSEK